MELCAKEDLVLYDEYINNVWRFIPRLEASKVIICCATPGCWRIKINC